MRMTTCMWKRMTAGLTALLLAGGATPPPLPILSGPPHPALWKLADKDTTIYLFGTFHLLPPGTQWRTPTIDRALTSSKELVLEIVLNDDPAQVAQVMLKLGMSPGLPPLLDRVPADKRDALAKMIADSGYPPAAFDHMETWTAALSLLGVSFVKLGFDPNAGVERQLTSEYKAAHKPIEGLETAEQQLGIFDRMSEEAQRAFLVGVLEDNDKMSQEFQGMMTSWRTGDLDGIARTFDTEASLSPELRDELIRKRNAAWTAWLARRLQQPGTIFVAVGAGHLAGADSVPQMLEARGLHPQRVE